MIEIYLPDGQYVKSPSKHEIHNIIEAWEKDAMEQKKSFEIKKGLKP
jgi:hypothetical protein